MQFSIQSIRGETDPNQGVLDMTRKRQLVLTTVGISIFLNSLTSQEKEKWSQTLNNEANATKLSSDMVVLLDEVAARAEQSLAAESVKSKRKLSAEMNGLYGLYEDQLQRACDDVHVLIGTDTVFGRRAVQVLETFLRGSDISNVQTWIPEQLSSANNLSFSYGIKELLRLCEENIPQYRDSGYRVIFNLTGAFKSLQSYLNIAGMFYADEIVYIFEGSNQLLRIPRLPIQVDLEILKTYCTQLALLDAGAILAQSDVAGLPEGLLDIDQHGDSTLSEWGRLIWNRARRDLYRGELLRFPNLVYEESFQRDFRRASSDEKVDLHMTLAKVSALLTEGDVTRLKQDGGIQYQDYQNRHTPDGQPIGHFRLTQARRVSCVAAGKTLSLCHFGNHDQVNDNS
jgi:putative CRISPR-associated protein (TIGR02619 family)